MAFIRKKEKGNSYYYELVENTRVDGKVVQKVLEYFPTINEASEYAKKNGIEFPIDKDEWIDESLGKILEEKFSKLNSLRPLSQSILERLRDKFEVDMTYNSNAIEGNRLTLRETWLVLRKGITIRGKSVNEHLEATNHAEAIGLLEKMADRKTQITEMDVLNLHAVILDKIDPHNAGFYRHEQVFIQGSELKLPDWRKVPELMKPVYAGLNSRKKGLEAVYSSARIHYETVRVHPFVDGNGRLARPLMKPPVKRAGVSPPL